jgi:aminopeptidase N
MAGGDILGRGMKGQIRVLFFLLLFSPVYLTAQSQQKFTRQDTLRGSLNPARAYDVVFYDLKVWPDIKNRVIQGENSITFRTSRSDIDSIQVDLFENYQIQNIKLQDESLPFRKEGNHIFVYIPRKDRDARVDPANSFQYFLRTIKIVYSGKPPEANNPPWDGGFVWRKDSLNRDWVTVACEGLGASSWWPCKDHLSDEPDSMRITCYVPSGLYCVSNGQLRNIENPEDGTTGFEWFVSYPINSYNVTLNIGNYDRSVHFYTRPDGSKLQTDLYFLDYSMPKADTFFFGTQNRVEKMLRAFEYYFGSYPYEKDGYTLVETPYWGMEHQSAVAYGNKFRLNEYGFDFILVHESGHEWWGNNISCKDQADMWLHESFTTYAEALYLEFYEGEEKAQAYLNMQRTQIKNREPMIGPVGVNYIQRTDNDIYYKGTWVLHTLRNVIRNDSLWFSILKTFQQKYGGQTVTTEDFENHVEALADRNFDAFFQQYLRTDSLPVLVYRVKQKKRGFNITYRWETPVKKFDLPMNVCIMKACLPVSPGPRWKKVEFRNVTTPEESGFHFDHDNFLFEERRVE